MTTLLVTLPRVQREEDERRDAKELTAVMEAIYGALAQSDSKTPPTVAFELRAQEHEIFFSVAVPEELRESLERQIHAQYPSAHLEPVSWPELTQQPATTSAALDLARPFIFPIRTYKQVDQETLNAIASALSKVGDGVAAVQLVVQPSDNAAQKAVEKALQNVQQGKTFDSGSGFWAKFNSVVKEVNAATGGGGQQGNQNEAKNTVKGDVRLTALQEQQAKLLTEKASKPLLKAQLRFVVGASSAVAAESQLQAMLAAYSQFQAPEANRFTVVQRGDPALLQAYEMREFGKQPTLQLTTEELTSVFHLPNRHLDAPNVRWLSARKLAPPVNLPTSGTALGYTDYRGERRPVFIKLADRMRHLYMLGKTGVGKTVLFQNMILQDIRHGHGVAYLDPNGDAVEWILKHIPKERADDVILIDPSDVARPIGLNLLEFDRDHPEQKTQVINELIGILDALYDLRQTGGPMFEYYLRNALLLLMDDPDEPATLLEVPRVLSDEAFRNRKLERCRMPDVVKFWREEAEKAGGEAALANIVPYISSKLNQFTTNDILRPMVGQPRSAFSFRKAMDERKIILVTLPKGLLGELNARLLGMLIVGKLQLAAFSRQDQAEEKRVPFFLYVDEFQNFTSKTFATILSEARKYRLSLNVTNQFLEQLDEDTRNAVIGNAGTLVAWRIGAEDAETLKRELDPIIPEDLTTVERFNFYVKLLIDGTPAKPFNAISYAPDPNANLQIGEAVRQLSRLTYGRDRDLVEREVRQRIRPVVDSGQ